MVIGWLLRGRVREISFGKVFSIYGILQRGFMRSTEQAEGLLLYTKQPNFYFPGWHIVLLSSTRKCVGCYVGLVLFVLLQETPLQRE